MPTTLFKPGNLVKLHPAWHHGYTAHLYLEPRLDWSLEFVIMPEMVGLYVKFIDDCIVPTLEGQVFGDVYNFPYYPADVILFGDQLIEIPTDVVVPLDFKGF